MIMLKIFRTIPEQLTSFVSKIMGRYDAFLPMSFWYILCFSMNSHLDNIPRLIYSFVQNNQIISMMGGDNNMKIVFQLESSFLCVSLLFPLYFHLDNFINGKERWKQIISDYQICQMTHSTSLIKMNLSYQKKTLKQLYEIWYVLLIKYSNEKLKS